MIQLNTMYRPASARIPLLTCADLNAVGYITRPGDSVMLKFATNPRSKHHILIITGYAGVGKSELAAAIANAILEWQKKNGINAGVAYIETIAHAWFTAEEMFSTIDPNKLAEAQARAAADPSNYVSKDLSKHGPLHKAALQSWHRPVVLLIDEFDKTMQRTENAMLSFLQSGIVQDSDVDGTGKPLKADMSNIIILLTSNGERLLSDPMLSRAMRYHMNPLEGDDEVRLLRQMTGSPVDVISIVLGAARQLRRAGTSFPSPREMANLLYTAEMCEDVLEMGVAIQSFLPKREGEMQPATVAELATKMFDAYAIARAEAEQAEAE